MKTLLKIIGAVWFVAAFIVAFSFIIEGDYSTSVVGILMAAVGLLPFVFFRKKQKLLHPQTTTIPPQQQYGVHHPNNSTLPQLPAQPSFMSNTTPAAPISPVVSVFHEQHGVDETQVLLVGERIKTAYKCKHGLYPHEILALHYAHTYHVDGKNNYQSFWWYRYGVRNVSVILSSLTERGFLQAGGLHAALNMQKVSELKDLLKSHGLKQVGNKSDLVVRIAEEIPEDDIAQQYKRRTYSLTESGEDALEGSSYVPYIHSNGFEDLDIWSLNRLMHTGQHQSFRDEIWGYLNDRSRVHITNKNYGAYRNCRYSIGLFLKDENRPKAIFNMFAEVVFWDIHSDFNPFVINDLINTSAFNLDIYFPSPRYVTAPAVYGEIAACQEALDYSDDDLLMAMSDLMKKLSHPYQLFSGEECARIFILSKNDNSEALEAIYSAAKKRFLDTLKANSK